MAAWLPPGIKDSGCIPQGIHIAQILDIMGFSSKKNGDYFVRIYFKCTTGESGPISLRFFANDPLKTWINTRNQAVMNLLLSVAHELPLEGKEPDWPKVLTGLKDQIFQITVKARDVNASPYLVSLDLYDPETDAPEVENVEPDDRAQSSPVPSPRQKETRGVRRPPPPSDETFYLERGTSRLRRTPSPSVESFSRSEDIEIED